MTDKAISPLRRRIAGPEQEIEPQPANGCRFKS
jgi:hypothetical protein